MSNDRKLAAILFADIAGYTSMMQHDEVLALNKLHHFKEKLNERVQELRGEIIQYYGDGCLMIFTNAVDAVNCAKQLQQDFTKDPNVPVRIGIHLGEILLDDGNIYGDSVNISSRIQSMGIPGAVLFSDTIKNQIKNKLEFEFISLGNIEFKNVDDPIEVFALSNSGFPVPDKANLSGKFKELIPVVVVADLPVGKKKFNRKTIFFILLGALAILTAGYFIYKNIYIDVTKETRLKDKSIAVLPFVDMSPEKDQEYFSDGLSEELINALAKISGLKVAGRTSSFYYKGINKNLKTIGDELGVSTILEGSLRKSGNQLRITAQLINTLDGFHLWSETFDIELTDIFAVQDKITKAIITALDIHLLDNKELAATATTNPEAYSRYLRARQKLSLRGEYLTEAKKLFEEAVKLDTDFSPAHAGLARTLTVIPMYLIQFNAKELMDSAKQEARKALELNPNNAEALSVLGAIAAYYDWDWDAAEQAFRKSITISPNDAELYNFIGDFYQIVLNKKLAVEMESKAVELDPLLGINYGNLAMGYYLFKEYDNAIRITNVVLSMNLQSFNPIAIYAPLVWTYLKLNQLEKAEEIVKKIPESVPLYMEVKTSIAIAKGDTNLAISNLRKMTNHSPSRLAEIYLELGMWDKAAESIEKAYSSRDVTLVYYSRITLPEDYPDHPDLKKAFDKPELNKLFEIRRKNLKSK